MKIAFEINEKYKKPEIHICSDRDDHVYLLTEKRQYRLRERLYELEEILDSDSFVRISNSEIVNVKKIIRLDTSITGTIRMYMKGDTQTFVSRRYVSRIKKTLKL